MFKVMRIKSIALALAILQCSIAKDFYQIESVEEYHIQLRTIKSTKEKDFSLWCADGASFDIIESEKIIMNQTMSIKVSNESHLNCKMETSRKLDSLNHCHCDGCTVSPKNIGTEQCDKFTATTSNGA